MSWTWPQAWGCPVKQIRILVIQNVPWVPVCWVDHLSGPRSHELASGTEIPEGPAIHSDLGLGLRQWVGQLPVLSVPVLALAPDWGANSHPSHPGIGLTRQVAGLTSCSSWAS